jgi:hypothetical protein
MMKHKNQNNAVDVRFSDIIIRRRSNSSHLPGAVEELQSNSKKKKKKRVNSRMHIFLTKHSKHID